MSEAIEVHAPTRPPTISVGPLSPTDQAIYDKIVGIDDYNADVIFKYLQFHKPADELQRTAADTDAFSKLVEDVRDKIRDVDFIPEWPITVAGQSVVLLKEKDFYVPEFCLEHLRTGIKEQEPEDYEDVLEFILSQCPLYISDVLQSQEMVNYAVEEWRNLEYGGPPRPFSIVYRNVSKPWFWTRWFGIGKTKPDNDLEGNPPVYPGEQATNEEELDDELSDFCTDITKKVQSMHLEEADRIIGMLLNCPSVQRQKMTENSVYLEKKITMCHQILNDK